MKQESLLYQQLKDQIFGEIVNGTRPDGSFLPTEEVLAKQYKMSRVTVRRALDILKSEEVITSVAGLGTRVTFGNKGHAGALSLIALITDSEYDFLKHFMKKFEIVAEANGGLVMLKTAYTNQIFSTGVLFEKLICSGVRDMVLWPLTRDLDPAMFSRIRAVGGNIVIFDQVLQVPWADTVCLDNTDAMNKLVVALKEKGCEHLALVAFSDMETATTQFRTKVFNEIVSEAKIKGEILRIPFSNDAEKTKESIQQLLKQLGNKNSIDGLIGISGYIGLALALENSRKAKNKMHIACFDYLEAMSGLEIIALEQPLEALSQKTYECLQKQNKLASKWRAGVYTFPGRIVVT